MGAYRDKILSLGEAARRTAEWRAAGDTIVLANGCFDLLHVGHVRYLQAAKREGARLVVGVNSDASTRSLKGQHRPILDERARAELVAALAVVDAAVIFDDLDVVRLIRTLSPDVHAKGTDYTEETVPEREVAAAQGARVAIVGDAKRHSTRELLAAIGRRQPPETTPRPGGS